MVRAISAVETRLLRAQILRPGHLPENLVYPGDDHPAVFHGGAFEGDRLVGIATIYPEAPPDEYREQLPAREPFRLRGMATTPDARGKGYGRQLLEACYSHMRNNKSDLLWCNARVVALDFYKRLDFQPIGPAFNIDGIGPHYVMWRRLQ